MSVIKSFSVGEGDMFYIEHMFRGRKNSRREIDNFVM